MTLPLTFLCTPPLVWAAVRFRQCEAAMLVVVLSGIAIWETLRGFGPLANVPTNESLLLLQVFMGSGVGDGDLGGAVVEERRNVDQEREHLLVRAQVARAEAEAANRAKDEFLAMLGHELRNPLAAIISAVSVLDRIGSHDDIAMRAREAIRHQITHLGRLVDDLLDIVHVASGQIVLSCEPLNLATSVQRSVSELASTGRLERHVVDVRAEPVWANADPVRLGQIVSNLLTNAIKYTSPGGTIRVRVSGEETLAIIGVSDSGIGIPSKLLPHMFDAAPQGERRFDHAQGGPRRGPHAGAAPRRASRRASPGLQRWARARQRVRGATAAHRTREAGRVTVCPSGDRKGRVGPLSRPAASNQPRSKLCTAVDKYVGKVTR
jgi:signal transduction histidine kinase